mgnify:CR=1 FL=1
MSSFKFGSSSKSKLSTCEPDLIAVMELAIQNSMYDFGITEGVRPLARQKVLFNDGLSRTLNSRHLANNNGKSEACDIVIYVNGSTTWDIKYYRRVAQDIFSAAIELGVQIEWGGLWGSFVDGPHFQLKAVHSK